MVDKKKEAQKEMGKRRADKKGKSFTGWHRARIRTGGCLSPVCPKCAPGSREFNQHQRALCYPNCATLAVQNA